MWLEGLGEEVVHARFDAGLAVILQGVRGHREDRHAPPNAQLTNEARGLVSESISGIWQS